jgi:heme-degrading monooxygenase HmoA
MTHTFFNVITLPEGDDTEALKAWAAVGEFMEKQPGFIGSTLYRNQMADRTLINKGLYETKESFMDCVKNPEFQKLSQVLSDLDVERLAGLYDKVKADGAIRN